MIKDKGYVHGTAAEKLGYDIYEENKVLKAKRHQRSNNKIKLKTVLMIFILFSFGCIVMYRYALITETNYKIEKKLLEYNEAKNNNIRLKVQIDEDVNSLKIEEKAVKELGMHKPDKYQITYVKVPRNDFTFVSEEAIQEKRKNSNVFEKLVSDVSSLMKLIN
ncbi:MAG: cell division protein FtsL [Clostridiaceae bacterium]|nr:cell division protein FtsL [Clostridiaceae bacterium]